MAAVENDNNNQLPSNKELQETCHHINIKHRVWIPFVIKRFIVFVTHQASKDLCKTYVHLSERTHFPPVKQRKIGRTQKKIFLQYMFLSIC